MVSPPRRWSVREDRHRRELRVRFALRRPGPMLGCQLQRAGDASCPSRRDPSFCGESPRLWRAARRQRQMRSASERLRRLLGQLCDTGPVAPAMVAAPPIETPLGTNASWEMGSRRPPPVAKLFAGVDGHIAARAGCHSRQCTCGHFGGRGRATRVIAVAAVQDGVVAAFVPGLGGGTLVQLGSRRDQRCQNGGTVRVRQNWSSRRDQLGLSERPCQLAPNRRTGHGLAGGRSGETIRSLSTISLTTFSERPGLSS